MNGNYTVIDQNYEYFEQLRDDAIAWDLDFRQTGAGALGHRLVQVAGPDFGLIYTIFRSPYDQRSVAPEGLCTFSILADERMPSTWCGHDFTANTLVAMSSTDEFRALSSGYFSNYVFSLPVELLAAAASEQHQSDWTDLQPDSKGTALRIGDEDIRALRLLLSGVTEAACFAPEYIALESISVELASLIVRALINASEVKLRRVDINRKKAFLNAQELIDCNLQSGISIEDICKQIGVSQRTLQYAFKEQCNISPKAYLNGQRLAQVRRELVAADVSQIKVTEAAGRWGFWHLGQFARDYRKIYGEKPSVTLARQH